MNAVAYSALEYDLVVVLRDGNPTACGKPHAGDGTDTHFADVEGWIFAGNAATAKGSRVVAVGVGRALKGLRGST
ncbi:hypothetical protein [Streptomyces exfoliatus]|uniref:hypothetical protein n=1 Tax=Streptomyces exfoliatus TaxID=1905 RepID=UPI003797679A